MQDNKLKTVSPKYLMDSHLT